MTNDTQTPSIEQLVARLEELIRERASIEHDIRQVVVAKLL